MEEKIVEIISKEDYKKYFNKNIINEKEWNDYSTKRQKENNGSANYHFFNTLVFNETEINKNENDCIH